MKILITGANGQLGNELRNVLESKLPGRTVYTTREDLDLTDKEATRLFLEHGQFTHVINCAGFNSVDLAEEQSHACKAINTDAVGNLAKYADEYGFRIIHISTDYVYDGVTNRPYTESDKVNPTSQFASSKRKGETLLLAMAPESIIIRTGWLFSPYGDNFVKKIIGKARQQPAIEVVSDRIGTPTYSYDLANAILTIITARQWVPGVFNFSNEGVASWYDFAKAIARITGLRAQIEPIPATDYHTLATRPYYTVLDKSRIKATYGLKIPHWEESLSHCISRMG